MDFHDIWYLSSGCGKEKIVKLKIVGVPFFVRTVAAKYVRPFVCGMHKSRSLEWILIILSRWVGVRKTRVKYDKWPPSGFLRYGSKT